MVLLKGQQKNVVFFCWSPQEVQPSISVGIIMKNVLDTYTWLFAAWCGAGWCISFIYFHQFAFCPYFYALETFKYSNNSPVMLSHCLFVYVSAGPPEQ